MGSRGSGTGGNSAQQTIVDDMTKAAINTELKFQRRPEIPEPRLATLESNAKAATNFNDLFDIAKELNMPVFLGFDSWMNDSYSTGPGVNYSIPDEILSGVVQNPNISSHLKNDIAKQIQTRRKEAIERQQIASNMPRAISLAQGEIAKQLKAFNNSNVNGVTFDNPKFVDSQKEGNAIRLYYVYDMHYPDGTTRQLSAWKHVDIPMK